MPVLFSETYRTAALSELRDLIDAGPGPGLLRYFGAATPDSEIYYLMGTATLTDPCGTLSAGVLTIGIASQVSSALTEGHLAYAELTDSTLAVHVTLPIVESPTPVLGALAVPMRHVIAGAPIYLMSFTIDHP